MALRMSTFIIGMIVSMLALTVFGLFMADVTDKYDVEYDNSSIEVYNKLSSINNLSRDVQSQTKLNKTSDLSDILGAYFSSGYKVVQLTTESYDTFDTMKDASLNQTNLGPAQEIIRLSFGSILLIVIFLGIVVSALVKREM